MEQENLKVKSDLVVYTVALGWAYDLPDISFPEGATHICFTDREIDNPKGWTIKKCKPLFPDDPFRSSREFKIRPHRWLREFERSIYIDTRVHLKSRPEDIWNWLMPHKQLVFGGLYHSERKRLRQEFLAVEKASLDYKHILDEQFKAYKKHSRFILHQRPVWGGFLARRHMESRCIDAMEFWFAHIMRYSRRDQLSLPLALECLSENEKCTLEESIYTSEYHTWPTYKNKTPYRKVGNL